MNRKLKIVTTILFIFSFFSIKAFSIGSGVQVGFVPSIDINQDNVAIRNYDAELMGTFKLFRIPAVFGFGIETGVDNSNFQIGVSGFFDYWFIDYQIENIWNLYSGAGISAKFMFDFNTNKVFSIGPRFFVGMNWLFFDNYIEYYAQLNAVPSYVNALNANPKDAIFRLSIPVETGVRVHF